MKRRKTEKTETPEADAADLEEKEEEKKLFESQAQGFLLFSVWLSLPSVRHGQEMVLRHFSHLMHYGEPHIRRAVPLAMGLVSASNPEMKVFDTLSRST